MQENNTLTAVNNFPHYEFLYALFLTCFAVLLVLTNVIGQKLFVIFGITLTSGIITYPLTFLITDIVSEIYGAKRAQFMVIVGFAMSLLMLVLIQVSMILPESPNWSSQISPGFSSGKQMQEAWLAVFGVSWWLVIGSMTAYMIAQFIDVKLFHFIRKITRGKMLWLRNNGSTLFSQLIDTFVVGCFLFYGALQLPIGTGLEIMLSIYVFKLAIALFDTPLCYLGVHCCRKYLNTG